MRKKYFILLLLGCSIITSCESTVIEDESAALPITRTIPVDFADHTTLFQDITPIDNGFGIECMAGCLESIDGNVEYDCVLFCALTGDVMCKVETDGNISYDGQSFRKYIYGKSGQDIRFTLKPYSTQTMTILKIEKGSSNAYKQAEARLLIEKIRYKGEQVTGGLKGSFDLTVRMKVPETPDSGYPDSGTAYHWTCRNCGFLNSINNSNCTSCGKKKS